MISKQLNHLGKVKRGVSAVETEKKLTANAEHPRNNALFWIILDWSVDLEICTRWPAFFSLQSFVPSVK